MKLVVIFIQLMIAAYETADSWFTFSAVTGKPSEFDSHETGETW